MTSQVKVTKELFDILKNAGTIHRNVMIKKDSDILRVKSPDNTLMLTAKVGAFPGNFVVYDIMELLSVLSLVESPLIEFVDDDFLSIQDQKGELAIKYHMADERMITGFSDRDLVPDEILVEFDLGNDKLVAAYRASATLKLPNLAFVGDGSDISFTALDVKLDTGSKGNSFKTKLCSSDKVFKIVFDSDNLKMLGGDYTVKIAKRKGSLIALFINKNQPIVYVMAVADSSEFNV